MASREIHLTRKGEKGPFIPATDEDRYALADVQGGDTIVVQWRKARNPGNHRRFFAMLKLICDNLPEGLPARYNNQDYLRYEAMIATGYCEWRESLGGTLYPVPKSMAFDKMDEDEFRIMYRDVSQYLLKHFSRMTDQELEENIGLL